MGDGDRLTAEFQLPSIEGLRQQNIVPSKQEQAGRSVGRGTRTLEETLPKLLIIDRSQPNRGFMGQTVVRIIEETALIGKEVREVVACFTGSGIQHSQRLWRATRSGYPLDDTSFGYQNDPIAAPSGGPDVAAMQFTKHLHRAAREVYASDTATDRECERTGIGREDDPESALRARHRAQSRRLETA